MQGPRNEGVKRRTTAGGTDGWTDRQINGRTEGWKRMDRWMDGQTDRDRQGEEDKKWVDVEKGPRGNRQKWLKGLL